MLTALAIAACSAIATIGTRSEGGHRPRLVRPRSLGAREDGVEQLAGELAVALAAGCRPIEALARCTKHRREDASRRGALVVLRVERGLDPMLAFQFAAADGVGHHESALYSALRAELTSGISAAPSVAAIARASAREARAREADRASRAAPLVQLIVALALVPSALLIGAALAIAGLGS